jgi:hypothetical protein
MGGNRSRGANDDNEGCMSCSSPGGVWIMQMLVSCALGLHRAFGLGTGEVMGL